MKIADAGLFSLKARYYLGRIALMESKPAEAVKWLEPIALLAPPVFDAAAQLSRAYQDAGEVEKAKSMTERAIGQTPWDGSLHYRLGRIYQQIGDSEAASKEFAESVRLKSADRDSTALLLKCSQQLAGGAIQDAMQIRQDLLNDASLDPDVLVALGLTFTGAGMQSESLQPFQAAAARDPGFYQAQYNAGLALLKLGRAAEATPYLEAAQRISGERAESNSALALAYVMQSRYAAATPLLEKWRDRNAGDARALNMLGLAYLRTNAAAKAVPVLRDAIRLAPADPKSRFLLIESLNAAEQQDAALEAAAEALARFPDLPQANLAKGQQLARVGRYQEAGPLFARAAELAPGRVDGLLGLAEVQQKGGDYTASLATYNKALAIAPGDTAASLGAARVMTLTKDFAGARTILEETAAAHPEAAQVHYELSRVYARLGEKDKATEQMRLFRRLRENPNEMP